MWPEEQSSLGRPIKHGKSDFCFISIFIRKDNGDKAMHLSSHQSKRRTLGEIRVAKVKQAVISVSSFFLYFYYDEILLIVISKETNSFVSAWKTWWQQWTQRNVCWMKNKPTNLYLRRHRRLWGHISIITVLLKRNQRDEIIKMKMMI